MLTLSLSRQRSLLTENHLRRELSTRESCSNLLSFCSNDYLQLATHPDVVLALQTGATQFGLGSGGSAQLAGYSTAHQQLEEDMAQFLGRDKALLFNSGYHANIGVITSLANRQSLVVSDKLCHASIIDGILLSRAKHLRFKHQSVTHAQTILNTNTTYSSRLLISESVFSMQGSIANIKALSRIAKDTNAMLIVDDAHGIGVLGEKGKGIMTHEWLTQDDVPCLITPLGKALASCGAIVSGKCDLIDTLVQAARSHRYSTALPPALCHATSAALRILQQESWRKSRLETLILFFNAAATERNLPLASTDITPIKSILIGCNEKTLQIQSICRRGNIHVSCIRPPTVPLHQSCIRISLNCEHTETQIIRLLDMIKGAIDGITKSH